MATPYQIAAPEPFDCSKSEEWSRWSRRFERFRFTSGLSEKSQKNQVNTLVYHMGDAADDILESFGLKPEEHVTVREKLESYVMKKKNTIYERAKFNSRMQEEGEPVEVFIMALHKLAAKCKFRDLHDELIRDRIVVGICNRALSEKMQFDEKLTLETATKLARENEAVRMQQSELREQQKTIDAIQTGQRNGKHFKHPPTNPPQRKGSRPSQRQSQPKSRDVCTRCGNSHPTGRDHCPAKTVKCHNCGKSGHYQKMRRSSNSISNIKLESPQGIFLGAITQDVSESWTVMLQLNNRPLNFKIDAGADGSVISEIDYCQAKDGPLHVKLGSLFTAQVIKCWR